MRRAPSPADPMSASERSSLRRLLAGLIGLVLLFIAGVLFVTDSGEQSQLWMSSCLRVGSVLCLLWLAWPQLARLHPWLILGGLFALIAVLALGKGQFRILLIAVAILVVMARVRPRAT